MKTFNDCFYNSENHKGFIEVFDIVDSEKLSDLIGIYTSDDVKLFDTYIKSQVGFLTVSPILDTIENEDNTTLDDKQQETIKMFLMLRYKELLKVKMILAKDLSISNGTVKTEDKQTVTESKNSVSSFNASDLEDDNENNYRNNTDNIITEEKTDTEQTIKNIDSLISFYRQSMYDKIIYYIKDLFTLQVVD